MPSSPPQIAANGSGATPAAPVQMAANGSGSSPASPVQIAGNGSAGTPAAPATVVQNDGVTQATMLIRIEPPANGVTLTIAGVTYTAQEDYTPADSEWDEAGTLMDIINGQVGPGAHPLVYAEYVGVDELDPAVQLLRLTALTGGSAGNAIAVSETGSDIILPGPTLTGGTDTTAPAAPAQMAANGSSATPTAPPAVV